MILGTIVANNALVPMGFVKSLLRVHEYVHFTAEGPSIPDNRNRVFDWARLENQDLLFIDSDMVFTPNHVKAIEDHLKDKDIVTGVYVMGFPGFPPALFCKEGDTYKVMEPKEEIHEIDACGAGFLGISKRAIQSLHEPFTPLLKEKYGQFYGEDISFCIRAQESGFKIWCDPSIQLGHIKTDVKTWKTR